MSKIGQRAASQAFVQNNRSEGPGKSKGKGRSNNVGGFGKAAKTGGKGGAAHLDDLPSVGLDVLGGSDPVERYTGGTSTSYTDDAVEQHNQIGAKAARGELLAQQGQGPNNAQTQNLRRQVDTLKDRLAKLESQLSGVEQTSPMQEVQRVTPAFRQRVGRAGGTTTSQRQTSLQTEQAAPIADKQQNNSLDDDLPRVGLHK